MRAVRRSRGLSHPCPQPEVRGFSAKTREFIGIRTKFGSRYLDGEEHWDEGPPYGTCTPVELLPDELPADIHAAEFLPVSKEVERYTPNDFLFAFLEEIEQRYPDWEGGWP